MLGQPLSVEIQASQQAPGIPGFVYWMPGTITAILGLKALAVHLGILDLREFLATLERELSVTNGSWEIHLAHRKHRAYSIFQILFWSLLVGGSVALAWARTWGRTASVAAEPWGLLH